jgi:hypothetical protein
MERYGEVGLLVVRAHYADKEQNLPSISWPNADIQVWSFMDK